MSVMVTYAREPRVRRPDTDSDTADTDTLDTLTRSSDSDATVGESGGSRYELKRKYHWIINHSPPQRPG